LKSYRPVSLPVTDRSEISTNLRLFSKSFRKTLESINNDSYKKSEFVDLLGVEPKTVVQLLDKEVINERILELLDTMSNAKIQLSKIIERYNEFEYRINEHISYLNS
jgi:hypothetical protein